MIFTVCHAVKLTLEVFVATALWAVDGSIEVPFFRRLDEYFFALQTRMESHKVDGHTRVKRRLGAL
jgi:hypothetical protein